MTPLRATESSSAKLAYGFAGFVAAGSLLLLPFSVTPFLRARLPYQHTPADKLKAGFEIIKRHRDKHRKGTRALQNPRFVDLGSGAGEATIMAAQRGYHALGVEINPTLLLISQINKVWQFGVLSRGGPSHCKFRCANLLSLDYSKFDVLFMFGVKPLLKIVEPKLVNTDQNTLLMLYRFKLPPAGRLLGEGFFERVGNEGELTLYERTSKIE